MVQFQLQVQIQQGSPALNISSHLLSASETIYTFLNSLRYADKQDNIPIC